MKKNIFKVLCLTVLIGAFFQLSSCNKSSDNIASAEIRCVIDNKSFVLQLECLSEKEARELSAKSEMFTLFVRAVEKLSMDKYLYVLWVSFIPEKGTAFAVPPLLVNIHEKRAYLIGDYRATKEQNTQLNRIFQKEGLKAKNKIEAETLAFVIARLARRNYFTIKVTYAEDLFTEEALASRENCLDFPPDADRYEKHKKELLESKEREIGEIRGLFFPPKVARGGNSWNVTFHTWNVKTGYVNRHILNIGSKEPHLNHLCKDLIIRGFHYGGTPCDDANIFDSFPDNLPGFAPVSDEELDEVLKNFELRDFDIESYKPLERKVKVYA